MKKIFRILNIRKHKEVVFANTYTSDGVRQQVVFDKKRKQENQEDNLLISHQSNNDRNAAIHAILWNLREKKSEK